MCRWTFQKLPPQMSARLLRFSSQHLKSITLTVSCSILQNTQSTFMHCTIMQVMQQFIACITVPVIHGI
jgi:putative flippase GtrA